MTQIQGVDGWGNPICGQDFMAGTICTRAPHLDPVHAAYCQACGGDWLEGTCECDIDDEDEYDEDEAAAVIICGRHGIAFMEYEDCPDCVANRGVESDYV